VFADGQGWRGKVKTMGGRRSISNITAALGDAAVISAGLAEDPGA